MAATKGPLGWDQVSLGWTRTLAGPGPAARRGVGCPPLTRETGHGRPVFGRWTGRPERFRARPQMCIRLESSAKKARVRKTIRAAITRNAATVQTNAGIRTWIAPQTIKINGMRL